MKKFVGLLIGTLLAPAFARASTFTLENYLSQVKNQNETIKANELNSQSFRLRVGEASLDFMPYAIADGTYSDDKRIGSINNLYGTDAVNESADVGVQKKFRTGTLLGLTYNWAYTQVKNSPFLGVPNYVLYTGAPEISITQPLWQDFNASLSKANEEATLTTLKAQEIQARFSNQQIISDAENAYWTLALQREIAKLDRESIERTGLILKRNQKRVSMNVTDKSDLLQSLASLKSKELTYQTDVEALREASMKFNSLRNVSNDSVVEPLLPIDGLLEADIAREIKRTGERADVLATIATARSAKAQAKASDIKNQPTLSFVGTYQFDGRGQDLGTSLGTSWNGDNPYLTAALHLKIPLDQGDVGRMAEGYRAAAAAAEATEEKAKFDLDQDWLDLQKHFKDAVSRLSLARELEKLQQEKLLWERERFKSGRTTSFQVLQFEDNFSDAELSRLRVENELVAMRAKARLYNNGDVK